MADDLPARLLTEGILKHYSEIILNIGHLMGLKYDTLENKPIRRSRFSLLFGDLVGRFSVTVLNSMVHYKTRLLENLSECVCVFTFLPHRWRCVWWWLTVSVRKSTRTQILGRK